MKKATIRKGRNIRVMAAALALCLTLGSVGGDVWATTGVGATSDTGLSTSSSNTSTSTSSANQSADAYLKSLTLDPGTLSPSFSPEVTSYTVTVDEDVDRISVTCAPANTDSQVTQAGGFKNLVVGTNTASITVQDANGGTCTYTFTIIRGASSTDAEAEEEDQLEAETTAEETTEVEAAEEAAEAEDADTEDADAEDGIMALDTEYAYVYDDCAATGNLLAGGESIYKDYIVCETFDDSLVPTGFVKKDYVFNGVTIDSVYFAAGDITMLYLISAEGGGNGMFRLYYAEEEYYIDFAQFVGKDDTFMFPIYYRGELTIPDNYTGTYLPWDRVVVSAYFYTELSSLQVTTSYSDLIEQDGEENTEDTIIETSDLDEDPEFYLIFGMNQDGDINWYLYDIVEDTYQRYVERDSSYDLDQSYLKYKTVAHNRFQTMCILGVLLVIALFVIINLILKNRELKQMVGDEDEEDADDADGEDGADAADKKAAAKAAAVAAVAKAMAEDDADGADDDVADPEGADGVDADSLVAGVASADAVSGAVDDDAADTEITPDLDEETDIDLAEDAEAAAVSGADDVADADSLDGADAVSGAADDEAAGAEITPDLDEETGIDLAAVAAYMEETRAHLAAEAAAEAGAVDADAGAVDGVGVAMAEGTDAAGTDAASAAAAGAADGAASAGTDAASADAAGTDVASADMAAGADTADSTSLSDEDDEDDFKIDTSGIDAIVAAARANIAASVKSMEQPVMSPGMGEVADATPDTGADDATVASAADAAAADATAAANTTATAAATAADAATADTTATDATPTPAPKKRGLGAKLAAILKAELGGDDDLEDMEDIEDDLGGEVTSVKTESKAEKSQPTASAPAPKKELDVMFADMEIGLPEGMDIAVSEEVPTEAPMPTVPSKEKNGFQMINLSREPSPGAIDDDFEFEFINLDD